MTQITNHIKNITPHCPSPVAEGVRRTEEGGWKRWISREDFRRLCERHGICKRHGYRIMSGKTNNWKFYESVMLAVQQNQKLVVETLQLEQNLKTYALAS